MKQPYHLKNTQMMEHLFCPKQHQSGLPISLFWRKAFLGSTKMFLFVYLFICASALCQAPVISYSGPKVYTKGTTITALAPTNSGGAVPAKTYGLVTSLLGS